MGVSFNTSHVTLYPYQLQLHAALVAVSIHLMLLFIPIRHIQQDILRSFQYISCYSLSLCAQDYLFVFPEFQYISCYSLSGGHSPVHCSQLRFNTSHVTLYLLSRVVPLQVIWRFNTSHVTLYPSTLQHFSHLTFL